MTVYSAWLRVATVVNNQIKQQGNVGSCTLAIPTYLYQVNKSNNRRYEYFGCKTTYTVTWEACEAYCPRYVKYYKQWQFLLKSISFASWSLQKIFLRIIIWIQRKKTHVLPIKFIGVRHQQLFRKFGFWTEN